MLFVMRSLILSDHFRNRHVSGVGTLSFLKALLQYEWLHEMPPRPSYYFVTDLRLQNSLCRPPTQVQASRLPRPLKSASENLQTDYHTSYLKLVNHASGVAESRTWQTLNLVV